MKRWCYQAGLSHIFLQYYMFYLRFSISTLENMSEKWKDMYYVNTYYTFWEIGTWLYIFWLNIFLTQFTPRLSNMAIVFVIAFSQKELCKNLMFVKVTLGSKLFLVSRNMWTVQSGFINFSFCDFVLKHLTWK